ncbi:hypothetical protein [Streptomyces sp. A30]|uniref:hypothetical protein n=1 Tax=Streptomyces sp. A30 TaxID=2789273 RepID=UPI0039803CAC
MGRTRGPEDKVALRHLVARRLSLRAVRLLIGAGIILLTWPLAAPLADQYRAQEAYRSASECPAGEVRTASGVDCLVPGSGTVTDKETEESCSTDSYGVESCATHYRLRTDMRVSGDARTEWIYVGPDTYRQVERGDRAELLLWRDIVVRITVGDHTEKLDPGFGFRALYGEWGKLWSLLGAWLAPGVALLVVFGRREMLGVSSPAVVLMYLFLGFLTLAVVETELFGPDQGWKVLLLVGFAALLVGGIVACVRDELRETA